MGTRGIPNSYGGFERFAEVISELLVQRGHSVIVLSPLSGGDEIFKGVEIVYIKTAKYLPRNIATLLYDLKSMLWAVRSNPDIILQCGYTFAIWMPFFGSRIRRKIVTNPDGLEYRRKKWNFAARLFLRTSERFAIKNSAAIVVDSPALVNHYSTKYGVSPVSIPYGSYICTSSEKSHVGDDYGIPSIYYLCISRPTPENSIQDILEVFQENGKNLVVVGNFDNAFGKKCVAKYSKASNIKFLGGIYNQNKLNQLRSNAVAYIHGHSVGGTNPSLIEAMGCGCFVIAHNNPFNRWTLDNEGVYFSNGAELHDAIATFEALPQLQKDRVKSSNWQRIEHHFGWDSVVDRYLGVFGAILQQGK